MITRQERLRKKNEATGSRVVAQYVQEFWECGWQPLEQRNDKGIDGIILMHKKGADLGARVNVQIKCGLGYISSCNENEIRISIDDASGLKKHVEYWQKQTEPVVLIFVSPCEIDVTEKKENWIESRLVPQSWWVDLKNENIFEGKTLIKIPIKQTFGEHSKGDFLKMVKGLVNQSENLQIIQPNEKSKKLLLADNLLKSARAFFMEWKSNCENGLFFCKSLNKNILISRTFWRHIVLSRRGKERRVNSLRLIGIAKQIIESVDENNFTILGQRNIVEIGYSSFSCLEQKIGVRAKVLINKEEKVVQVIILRRKFFEKDIDKYWLYSVHYKR